MALSMQRYIIISGIPASGKSTVGRAVAATLGLVFLDKDDFLEAMFHSRGIGDAQWRARLSRDADETLREQAFRSDGAVITSWWRHPSSQLESGTPVEWLSSLPGVVTELHCVCDPQIAARRFLSRRRHSGHLDHLKKRADVLTDFQQQAALGPLGLARVIEINTGGTVDVTALAAQIDCRSLFSK